MSRQSRGPYLELSPHGRYEIRWSEGTRSRRRSTGTSDFQLAQKVLANFLLLDEREAIRAEKAGAYMVRSALGDEAIPDKDYWHEHVMPNVIDKASVRFTYVKLLAHFGHLAVKDISPDDVAGYVAARRSGKIGRPSVNHTISRELSVLNAAINHAVHMKRVPKVDQPFIKMPGTSPARDRWLTEAEADRLAAAALAPWPGRKDDRLPRIYRFVMLALGTASRRTALLELKWQQIDLERRLVYLNPEGRQQTNKRRVSVPISDELLPVLQRAHSERKGDYVLDHAGSIRTAWAGAVRRAGLGSDVTPHVLRHTWATWSAQGGTPLFDIAGVLGDRITTVMKTYAHHAPEHLRSAINSARPSARLAEQRMTA